MGDTFTFNMDNFSNASGLANDAGVVSAVTTITVTQTTGTEVFPNTIKLGKESPCVASCLVANSDTGWVTFGPSGDGDSREINLTTRNLLIASALSSCCDHDHDNSALTPNRQGVFLGEFELEAGCYGVLESGSAFGPMDFNTGSLNDGRGNLIVTVTGDFQGGSVFYDLDDDGSR